MGNTAGLGCHSRGWAGPAAVEGWRGLVQLPHGQHLWASEGFQSAFPEDGQRRILLAKDHQPHSRPKGNTEFPLSKKTHSWTFCLDHTCSKGHMEKSFHTFQAGPCPCTQGNQTRAACSESLL